MLASLVATVGYMPLKCKVFHIGLYSKVNSTGPPLRRTGIILLLTDTAP